MDTTKQANKTTIEIMKGLSDKFIKYRENDILNYIRLIGQDGKTLQARLTNKKNISNQIFSINENGKIENSKLQLPKEINLLNFYKANFKQPNQKKEEAKKATK